MRTITLMSRSESQTREIGIRLARSLRRGDVVAIDGELGAGKTRLVAGIAEGLGLDGAAVSSPTFVICHLHDPSPGRHGPSLAHLDAYRLSGPGELESIGWDELLDNAEHVVAIEWASKVRAALPALHVAISIEDVDRDKRRIVMTAPDALADRLERLDSEASYPCAFCGRALAPEAEHHPFCSERCRLADLGAWLSEKHRLS